VIAAHDEPEETGKKSAAPGAQVKGLSIRSRIFSTSGTTTHHFNKLCRTEKLVARIPACKDFVHCKAEFGALQHKSQPSLLLSEDQP
jgi:hypothetical protein